MATYKEIQEFDPGEDLTVLIQSSEIKDADDANAVAVSVENSSDKTMYVKEVQRSDKRC